MTALACILLILIALFLYYKLIIMIFYICLFNLLNKEKTSLFCGMSKEKWSV